MTPGAIFAPSSPGADSILGESVRRLGNGAKRRLLLGVSTLVALAGAEILLIFFSPIEGLVYRVDEETLVATVPGARKIYIRGPDNGGDRILVRFDRDGFRGPELGVRGEDLRVAVYGDSFVEAEYSREARTFVELLGQRLSDATGRRVATVNAGVVGFGPDQAILRVEREQASLDPDLVVLTLVGNDFGDLLRNRLFRLGENDALLRNRPEISPAFRQELAPREGLRRLNLVRGGALLARGLGRLVGLVPPERAPDFSWVPTYVDGALTGLERDYENYVKKGDSVVRTTFEDYWDADIALRPEAASSAYKIRLLRALLEHLRDFAESRRLGVVLVIIPTNIDACETTPYGPPANKYPEFQRSKITDTFAAIARDAELPAIDLFQAFRANDPCSLYFRVDDDHWNDDGQALAAAVVGDEIVDRRLLIER
jgi:lysophospholipase L1-like esterase